MKNPHTELVKKWLDNPESVSLKELERAADAAAVALYAVNAAAVAVALYAVNAAAVAVVAVDAVDAVDTARSEFWIEKYEELTQ